MSESMITRCPKCSTTFRVTQEVLNMAKGKVRCGQCFHIFAATPIASTAKKTAKPKAAPSAPAAKQTAPKAATPKTEAARPAATPSPDEEGAISPDWLDTLFDEEDLKPYQPSGATDNKPTAEPSRTSFGDRDSKSPVPDFKEAQNGQPNTRQPDTTDLAPWEVELAQIEEQFSASVETKEPIFTEKLAAVTPPSSPASAAQAKPAQGPAQLQPNNEGQNHSSIEPDYMRALHSLAQDISKQDTLTNNEYTAQESMHQLAAEYNLASLTDGDQPGPKTKSKFRWLWRVGTLVALVSLVVQVAVGFFEQGSRSSEFRSFYQVACSYFGCTLPTYENIAAIDIEHVRIQSHPTLANTLQVNAIMTNTSRYAQPMPKLALEFYDLNGNPVAARLFAPKSYLHKDFLDITYMPPSTPIHIVIPIQDPGARAVTHKIKLSSSKTQSY